MAPSGAAAGLKRYAGSLVAVILFPLLWLQLWRLAERHSGDDPRAKAKVATAIVAGIVILAGGAFMVLQLRENALWSTEQTADEQGNPVTVEKGIYHSLDVRLATAVGETAYREAEASIPTVEATIATIQTRLAEAQAAGDEAKAADLEAALASARQDLAKHQATVAQFTANHQYYESSIRPHILAQDDAALQDAVDGISLDTPDGAKEDAQAALDFKHKTVREMDFMLNVFVWPSLVGAFLAPLAFAAGSILRKSFVESDTVGFKPYPGAAAGFFLLLGAFGPPSIPFAAWTFMDAKARSEEGQISL